MDNQFGSSYQLPYAQNTHSPAHQAPMGNYAAALTQQSQQAAQPGSAHAPAAAQQDSAHPTLPPLQGQNGYAQFGSMSYGHPNSGAQTPTTHTPTSSSLANAPATAYSHVAPASAMGPPNGFSNHYSSSQPMLYPSPTSTSLPQANGNGLRPVLPASIANLPSLSSTQLGQQNSFLQNEEAPTHVVGSQGRRGILPSAPGRPNATASGPSIKNMMPVKDADGKFPCPHCNKTYLHAKHLKRHMLRHTGDRPYSCHLCKDTFSRSDILKRHFQKCSIRRGNPTGANHLAHQRRGNNNNRLSMSQQEGPIGLAGLSEVTGSHSYGGNGLNDNSPTINGDVSNRTSRANSLISPVTNLNHRNSLAGLGILGNSNGAAGPGANDPLSAQGASFTPNMHSYGLPSVTGSSLPSAYAFSSQPSINGAYFQNPQSTMPYLGHPASRFDHSHSNSPSQQSQNGDHPHVDSNRLFGQNAQDGYINGNNNSQNGDNGKNEHDVKHFPGDINNELSNNGSMGVVWS